MNLNIWIQLLYISLLCLSTNTTTHWFMNDDGKIQAQMDSIFQLRRPYDFLALIQQEHREKHFEQLKKELMYQKSLIDNHEDKDTQIEERIYGTYSDCILAERPLTHFNLYAGTNIDLEQAGIDVNDYMGPEPYKGTLYKEPDCESAHPLAFSMFSLDHLKGVLNRSNLTATREDELANLNGNYDVGIWGHQVSLALKKNSTSWVLYTLAAQYWRFRAKPNRAIECIRRALVFSPSAFRYIPLLHMGNVLHRSRESEDASIALHMAVDLHKSSHVIYGTLGSVYATLGYYNVSVLCLENALHISTNSPYLEKLRHAVLCHAHLESSLGKQLQSLQHTLGELREYQKKHDELLSLRQKMLLEQATPEMKLESRLEYEEQKIRESADGRGQDCFQYQQDGHTFLSCNMRRDQLEQQGSTELLLDLHSLLHAVETEIMRLGKQVLKKKPSLQVTLPPITPLAPTLNKHKAGFTVHLSKIYNDNFPTPEQCEEAWPIPQWNEFPTAFLQSENKNLLVDDFLTWRTTGMRQGTFQVPICPPFLQVLPFVDEIPSVKERHGEFPRFPDPPTEYILARYGNSLEETGHNIAISLTETDEPHWVLYNMAGLYWRAVGNTQKGIDCIRRAMATTPPHLMDVPLVNLASLVYKAGHIDDALTLAMKAIEVDYREVETNFLLANLNFAKGNITGAWLYYEGVLIASPDLEAARQYYTALACHMKNPNKLTPQADKSRLYHKEIDDDDFDGDSQKSTKNGWTLQEPVEVNKPVPEVVKNTETTDEVIPLEVEETIEDDLLPDVLLRVREKATHPVPPPQSCDKVIRLKDIKHFTSTWLSGTAKDIDISEHLVPPPKEGTPLEEPICRSDLPASMHTLDHLSGIKHRDKLPHFPELGLKDAFQTLTDRTPQPMDILATRIARSLHKNESSWVTATAAALYWRVMGSGPRAVDCLRQALHYSPRNMKDIPLISLSNIFHRSGLLNAALIVGNMALEISPNFVVVHFSMANIYAAKGDFEKAAAFYQSTLSLQSSFEPARDRLRVIQCATMDVFS